MPAFRLAGSAVLLASCLPLGALLTIPCLGTAVPDEVAVVKQTPEPYLIVIGEGLVYFELEEAMPEEIKSRLVCGDTPPGVISPDPTNEHHLNRWRSIRPDLKVVSATDFFAQNR